MLRCKNEQIEVRVITRTCTLYIKTNIDQYMQVVANNSLDIFLKEIFYSYFTPFPIFEGLYHAVIGIFHVSTLLYSLKVFVSLVVPRSTHILQLGSSISPTDVSVRNSVVD